MQVKNALFVAVFIKKKKISKLKRDFLSNGSFKDRYGQVYLFKFMERQKKWIENLTDGSLTDKRNFK